jgi:hypothetical protein
MVRLLGSRLQQTKGKKKRKKKKRKKKRAARKVRGKREEQGVWGVIFFERQDPGPLPPAPRASARPTAHTRYSRQVIERTEKSAGAARESKRAASMGLRGVTARSAAEGNCFIFFGGGSCTEHNRAWGDQSVELRWRPRQ